MQDSDPLSLFIAQRSVYSVSVLTDESVSVDMHDDDDTQIDAGLPALVWQPLCSISLWASRLLFDQRSLPLIMYFFFQRGETEIHESLMVANTLNSRGMAQVQHKRTRAQTHTSLSPRQTAFHHALTTRQANHIM